MAFLIALLSLAVIVGVLVLFFVVMKKNGALEKVGPKQMVLEGHEIKKRTWVKNWDGTAVAYTECECRWNRQGRDPIDLDKQIRDHLREEKKKLELRERNQRLIEEGKDKDIAW